jgi:two-component system phosphate regulon sensor histidine kinase PhoR
MTERLRRERAEREFVANAAHELRTPVAAIAGAVEVLQAGAKHVPEERDRFLEHIEREALRLGRLASALLTLARAEAVGDPAGMELVELAPLLRAVASDVRPASGVRVRVRCRRGVCALADEALLEQAVSNVAHNAARHTSAGSIDLSAHARDGTVEIAIADTGSGMRPEDATRALDRFYRGPRETAGGFGLGLAIVAQAMRTMGGAIDVESAVGVGTTVRLRLPAAERA